MTNHSQDNNSIQKVNKKLFKAIKARSISKNEIKELVEKQGADVNAKDDTGSTALHEVVKHFFNSENIIDYLIKKGANPNAKDQDDLTPLQQAIKVGNCKIAQYLIDQGADFEVKDQDGFTPLQQLITERSSDVLYLDQYLLKKGADVNTKDNRESTPLHKAAYFHNSQLASQIISLGADVNAKDNQASTPLHELAKRSVYNLGSSNIFSVLVNAKAKIDESDNEGFTPLLRAAQSDNAAMMNGLLSCGANITATNNRGESILDIAVKNQNDNIISVLLTQNIEELNIPSDSSYLFALLRANGKDSIHPPKALSNLKLIQEAYENLPDTDWRKHRLLEEIETQQTTLLEELDKYKVYEYYLKQPPQKIYENKGSTFNFIEGKYVPLDLIYARQKVGWSEFKLLKEEHIARFKDSDLSINKAQEDYTNSQSITFQVPDQATFSPFALIPLLRPFVSWLTSKISAPYVADTSSEPTVKVDTPNIGEATEQLGEIEL
ncbi:ankyrin repeat protein [Candidatus Phycorickettsia trachydisci]|uniref:Ankyrin repeat protein n=1 Tax=Candidatus Phycorickettsia trachydisci TaxID=2115978 RepID=A0A2P1P732_9RICK|nr:ankyrin repeat domain-containing protein [Candidatus Phycorickettsia trachydisci]AVP87055.1 ankyrin repeat protein [Candidatus Phycorickettsia trachydisci]